jgi:hypothetical protein
MRTQIALVSLAVGSIASASAAQVISFNDSSLFTTFAVQNGAAVSTEGFDSYNGFAASYTGNLGGVQWLASATAGMFAQGGLMSTNNPESMTFSFGGSGVKGVGGQFFSTDINFNFVPSTIYVTLSDGSGFVGSVTSGSQFTGFWSLGSNISSIRVQPLGGSIPLYPTADTLSIAVVPAPGAVALLAMAGTASRRRRRA